MKTGTTEVPKVKDFSQKPTYLCRHHPGREMKLCRHCRASPRPSSHHSAKAPAILILTLRVTFLHFKIVRELSCVFFKSPTFFLYSLCSLETPCLLCPWTCHEDCHCEDSWIYPFGEWLYSVWWRCPQELNCCDSTCVCSGRPFDRSVHCTRGHFQASRTFLTACPCQPICC